MLVFRSRGDFWHVGEFARHGDGLLRRAPLVHHGWFRVEHAAFLWLPVVFVVVVVVVLVAVLGWRGMVVRAGSSPFLGGSGGFGGGGRAGTGIGGVALFGFGGHRRDQGVGKRKVSAVSSFHQRPRDWVPMQPFAWDRHPGGKFDLFGGGGGGGFFFLWGGGRGGLLQRGSHVVECTGGRYFVRLLFLVFNGLGSGQMNGRGPQYVATRGCRVGGAGRGGRGGHGGCLARGGIQQRAWARDASQGFTHSVLTSTGWSGIYLRIVSIYVVGGRGCGCGCVVVVIVFVVVVVVVLVGNGVVLVVAVKIPG